MEKRLFIVANRLPLTIEIKDWTPVSRQSSGGLISSVQAYLAADGKELFAQRFWVGIPGCEEETWAQVNSENEDFIYLPVFTASEQYERYYDGFSNSLLWPLFHYFPSYSEYHDADFEAYESVNQKFADRLLAELRPGDLVWIHDYHLLPLAAMLRKHSADVSIAFFLHIPFPAFEVFRLIPKRWQKELLNGILGADLIGFHTSAYREYFLNAATQVMEVTATGGEITWQGRTVSTGFYPVGIDFELFHNAGTRKSVQQLTEHYRALKNDKKMLFSVDRLDYTKGVHHRIKGYKKFLLQHPEYCGHVVFVLVIVPSRHHIKTYAERKRMIDEYIGNINSSLGTIDWKPVIYQYQHLEFDELAALYRACDVALITPLRDGMNLVAKEFVASRDNGSGVLILSELAGAADELGGAILINPNDTAEIASAIQRSLEMSAGEQRHRLKLMQDHIREHNVHTWAARILERLTKSGENREEKAAKLLDPFIIAQLLHKYAAGDRRLLLLDYDGTLLPFASRPEQAKPSAELIALLEGLVAQAGTDIYIVSGRDVAVLDKWFADVPIGLVAEHGAQIKQKNGKWKVTRPIINPQWSRAEQLMNKYVEDCAGSFIEFKIFSRAWHYREVDAFHGEHMARKLYNELIDLADELSLNVLKGHKVIEIRSKGTHKGKAVMEIVNSGVYDVIVCIGDDNTDEDMFRSLRGIKGTFTIKVGAQPSSADYRVLTPYQVHSLLENILNYPQPFRREEV
ncbi:MAG TPA: bifunctional alpha,alpha-trehalose-phosphate synthase (UDP-forming)/trehalose-phosphatase [Mucilaginibacter sp.]